MIRYNTQKLITMNANQTIKMCVGLSLFLFCTIMYGQDKPQITMGNGESNWIALEDVKRDGPTLTFSDVNIVGDGWLVIHPFEDGKPNGDKYVGATFLNDGNNQNVEVLVHKGLDSGEMIIVMLHSDSNSNQIFDFVFVDDVNVMDRAVFEGNVMIAHAISVP